MKRDYRADGWQQAPKLSICIATYNRAQFVGETLDSVLAQKASDIEIIVVDGASPDSTPEVMGQYLAKWPNIRYYREIKNSGIDADYDKAVSYASGEYCWLMTDDDLLRPGAVQRVLAAIEEDVDLVVVNSEIKDATLSQILEERRLPITCDRRYGAGESESFFAEAANYLSFIGCVIVRRELWLSRERASYYGTLFIHVGVIFQSPPIGNVKIIADPLIAIRYGNAMWTPRGFEIWMFKWPELIWSFAHFSDSAKLRVCHREPWRSERTLFYYRATGAYSLCEFRKFLLNRSVGIARVIAYAVGVIPATVANLIAVIYLSLKRAPQMAIYDVLRSRHTTTAGRLFARAFKRRVSV